MKVLILEEMKKKTQAMKADILTSTSTAPKAMISINIRVKMKVKQAETKIEVSDIMSRLEELILYPETMKIKSKSHPDYKHIKNILCLKYNRLILFNCKINLSKTIIVNLLNKILNSRQKNLKY